MRKNSKGHIIDNDGDAYLKNVETTGDLTGSRAIPIGVVEVTSTFYKCHDGKSKNKEKIADDGDKIYYICADDREYLWFKVESKVEPRNEVLWRRTKNEVMKHGDEVMITVWELQAEMRGMFYSKDVRSECFFVPFGILNKFYKPSGVWISNKYYREVMTPHAKQINQGTDQYENEKEEEEEEKHEEEEEQKKKQQEVMEQQGQEHPFMLQQRILQRQQPPPPQFQLRYPYQPYYQPQYYLPPGYSNNCLFWILPDVQ